MLKIKDNVDLKELKKFGFVRCEPDEYYNVQENEDGYIKETVWMLWENDFGTMSVSENTRKIWGISVNQGNILYDLIQAGLVEKV